MKTFKFENVNFTQTNPEGRKAVLDFLSNTNLKAQKLHKIGSDFNRNSRYQNVEKLAEYLVSGKEIDSNKVESALHNGRKDFDKFLEILK